MSKLTDNGIIVSNAVATLSAAELFVSENKYTMSLVAEVANDNTVNQDAYIVQGGYVTTMDLTASDLLPEADLSIRHQFPANKFQKALVGTDPSLEVFDFTVASEIAAFTFEWAPLIALVKDGVTTYEFANPILVHTGSTGLVQAAIASIYTLDGEPSHVMFEFAPGSADSLVHGENFTFTQNNVEYFGLVRYIDEDQTVKGVLVQDLALANAIRATVTQGPISFAHLMESLGNFTIVPQVSVDTLSTGYSLIQTRPTMDSAGTKYGLESKGEMFNGAGGIYAQEGEESGLIAIEAFLDGLVKSTRLVFDRTAYHMDQADLTIGFGLNLTGSTQGVLKVDGSVATVVIDNDLLHDYIMDNVGETLAFRVTLDQAFQMVDHYTVLATFGLPLELVVNQRGESIKMAFDASAPESPVERIVNPDMVTTSEDILHETVITKLGVVIGEGLDADKVVLDVEGAQIGDVVSMELIHSTVDAASAGITIPTAVISGVKRRDGMAYTSLDAEWAAYVEKLADANVMGSMSAYSMAVTARIEYAGRYEVTVGDNGVYYGFSALFGAINDSVTTEALGFINAMDAGDTLSAAQIIGVKSNGTSFEFILSGESIKATGKQVKLVRSTDGSADYLGTITRNEAGDIVALFPEALAFELANEYGDGNIFSFDLVFTGEDNVGQYLVKTDGIESTNVTATYVTEGNALITAIAVDDTAQTTTLALTKSEPQHAVYQTTFLSGGETVTDISNIVGVTPTSVAYPDVSVRTAIAQSIHTAFNIVALPLGNNAIQVAQTVGAGFITYGFNAAQGDLYYDGVVIEGKFDAEAAVKSIDVKKLDDGTLTGEMRVHTAGLEAIGKTVKLTTAAGIGEGVLEEQTDGTYLVAVITGDAFLAGIVAVAEDQWTPISIDFEGTSTLVIPEVMLVGGGSTTLPYSTIAGEITGELRIDENLAQNSLDQLKSIRVDGTKVIITTEWPTGSQLVLDKIDSISQPGDLLSFAAIVDGVGIATIDDAQLAEFMSESAVNALVFDVRITLGNPDAEYQVTFATNGNNHGYIAGTMGAINTNVFSGEEDKFNSNRKVLITDVFVNAEDVTVKLNETAIQQVGRTLTMTTIYGVYTGVVMVQDGEPTVLFGADAQLELSVYPDGFMFGFDLAMSGVGTMYIGTQVLRTTAGTAGKSSVAVAQDAPIGAPGYIVTEQAESEVLALKEIVARNDGESVRLVLG